MNLGEFLEIECIRSNHTVLFKGPKVKIEGLAIKFVGGIISK